MEEALEDIVQRAMRWAPTERAVAVVASAWGVELRARRSGGSGDGGAE